MWYVVQVKSGDETDFINHFVNEVDLKLYKEVFSPYYLRKKKMRGEWIDTAYKLFPGYVIIDTEKQNITDIHIKLHEIPGITKLLKSGDEITPISREEERFYKSIMDDTHKVKVSVGFIIGDKICITKGPLKHASGRIKKIDRHKRIAKVEVLFFGHLTEMEVGLEIVKKIGEDKYKENKEVVLPVGEGDIASDSESKLKKSPLISEGNVTPDSESDLEDSNNDDSNNYEKMLYESLKIAKTDEEKKVLNELILLSKYHPGDSVKIISGVFAGEDGTFMEADFVKREAIIEIRLSDDVIYDNNEKPNNIYDDSENPDNYIFDDNDNYDNGILKMTVSMGLSEIMLK